MNAVASRGLLIVAWVLLGLSGRCGAAAAEVISVADYQRALIGLDGRLAAHDASGATAAVQHLTACRIGYDDELLAIDPALRLAVQQGSYGQARHRIGIMLAQLALTHAGHADAAPDPAALQRIATAQRQAATVGGEVDQVPIAEPDLGESLNMWITDRLTDLRDAIRHFWRWLKRWFVGDDEQRHPGASGHMTLLVIIAGAVILVGFALLALFQRSPTTPALVPGGAGAPAADEDPRSRASAEWQRYGDQLAREGRWREAVRAWYHAVLVQCWVIGTLRHRVGSTNWEYAARLPPGWPQRAAFVELTSRFDRVWYGNLASRDEAEDFSRLSLALAQSLVAR